MKKLLLHYKILFILKIDLIAGFLALSSMILLRYGGNNFNLHLKNHFIPFLIIICIFILIFFIFNLYSFRFNRNITEFTNSFIKSLIISFSLSILVFYIFGDLFNLTPKTNLVIFTLIFGVLDFYLRVLTKRYLVRKKINRKIILIDKSNNELVQEIRNNQNIGYDIIKETFEFNLDEIINLKPDIVIIDSVNKENLNNFYPLLKKDIRIITINNFYEETFQKIPIEKMEDEKVMEYISKNKFSFNLIKRLFDLIFSLSLLILTSPLFILTSIFIKITSKGPILIRQKRISKGGEIFVLYKFRSMIAISEGGQAEINGAVWTETDKNDPRITPFGKFIRKTHLDEIPQLINILKGNLSFVGPRPERPEFTKILEKEMDYYDLRHSVKAGLTGWAQVNYKYGASIEDSMEKLKYDFYYIKNRNIFFDILIIIKTVAKIFSY